MDFQDDAAEFSSEDVDTIVKNAITGCLTDVMYNPKKVSLTKTTNSSEASCPPVSAELFCRRDVYCFRGYVELCRWQTAVDFGTPPSNLINRAHSTESLSLE